MVTFLAIVFTTGLILQALVGLTFFVSSIFEKERRASIFGGLQLFGMIFLVAGFLYIYFTGRFNSWTGVFVLALLVFLGLFVLILFCRRTSPNEKALKGAMGYVSGKISRFDERETMFFAATVLFSRVLNNTRHTTKNIRSWKTSTQKEGQRGGL